MDVTALLNSSGGEAVMGKELGPLSPLEHAMTSVEQSSSTSPIPSAESTPHVATCESRTPSRSRTPWDAGGYSLPLASDPFSIRTSSLPRIPHDRESPTDQPTSVDFKGASPQHKFSDSRSSLSSYTPSSTASVSHSRISSLSTVGEDQTFDIDTAADNASLLKTRDQQSTTPDSHSYTDKDTSIPQLIQVVSDIHLAGHHSSSSKRPQSPSDAVLITRDQVLEKVDASAWSHRRSGRFHSDTSPLIRGHKRAVSAPNFRAMASQSIAPIANMGPIMEPSPGESNESISPRTSQGLSASATPPTEIAAHDAHSLVGSEEPHEAELKCLFQESCDLQAPLRKAISHIFGRNKTSTRQVPKDLWVYLCRKHYQRSRYRNASEYARLQCDLVHTQIDRIMAWSDENRQKGINTGVVKDWSIGIRKRELERLKGKKGNGRKRALQDGSEGDHDEDDDDEDEGADTAELNGTAVPEWLLQRVGDGYSADEIRQVMKLIQAALDDESLKLIPDIEILINFVEEISDSKKATKRRNVNGQAHKRSQSVGVGMRREVPPPMARRPSHPGFSVHDSYSSDGRGDHYQHPRGRGVGDLGQHYPALSHPPERRHTVRLQLPHRPAFSNIQEYQAQETFPAPSHHAMFSGFQGFGPTPQSSFAPTGSNSQRRASVSMTQQPEAFPPRRPALHQRSHSEFRPAQPDAPVDYRTNYSSAYGIHDRNPYSRYGSASNEGHAAAAAAQYPYNSFQVSSFSQMPPSGQATASNTAGTRHYEGMPPVDPASRAQGIHTRLPQVPESSSRSTLYAGRTFLPPVVPHYGNNPFTPHHESHASSNELPPIACHQPFQETPHSGSPKPVQPRTVQETDRAKEIFSSRR